MTTSHHQPSEDPVLQTILQVIGARLNARRTVRDRARRRKVRAAARAMVPHNAWTEPACLSPQDVANLILLRGLYLQTAVRRAASLHQRFAAIVLARSSIDAAISAIYALYVPGAIVHFEGGTARDLRKLLNEMAEEADKRLLDGFFEEQLGDAAFLPVGRMVEQIEKHGGPASVRQIYSRYYVPLSGIVAHAGPLSLQTHVHPRRGTTRRRPYPIWSRRSAVHTADAMMALIASEVAGVDHPDISLFVEYGNSHWQTVWPPLAFVLRGLAVTRLDYRIAPALIVQVLALRRKARSGVRIDGVDLDRMIEMLCRLTRSELTDPVVEDMKRRLRLVLIPEQ